MMAYPAGTEVIITSNENPLAGLAGMPFHHLEVGSTGVIIEYTGRGNAYLVEGVDSMGSSEYQIIIEGLHFAAIEKTGGEI